MATIETIAAFEDDVVRAEVFTVDGGKPRVRVIDLETGLVVPSSPVFKTNEQAIAYAERCIR